MLARLSAFLLALFVALPAAAWEPLDQCSGGAYTRWAAGNPNTVWKYSSSFMSADLSESIVTARVQSAFNEWGVPGCSEFDASRGSNSASDPMGNSGDNLIGFYESSWPSSLGGSSVLAVTFTSWVSNCIIPDADMVVNGVHHTWVDGNPSSGNQADLQAILTHEIGHWIGLDHSNYSGSSLQAFYSGGIGERTLTCDDSTAACTLYPSGGNTCTADRYCQCTTSCSGGTCSGGPPVDPNPGGTCSGNTLLVGNEAEPNDWEGDDEINWFAPTTGGDLQIKGNVTCGNNGSQYTADNDWFVIDFPCSGSARFVLDWERSSDLDFMVWGAGDEPFADNLDVGMSGPSTDQANAGGRVHIFVACWEGQTTSYTMTVDWAPFTPLDDNDTDDTDDTDDTEDPGDFDTGEGLFSCNCSTAGRWPAAFSGLTLLLLGAATARRRAVRAR